MSLYLLVAFFIGFCWGYRQRMKDITNSTIILGKDVKRFDISSNTGGGGGTGRKVKDGKK